MCILTCFNFSHLQSTLNLIQYTYWDFFPTAQFFNLLILMPFSASAVFCFTSYTLEKHFSLRTFFIWGNKKRSCSEWDWMNRVGVVRGSVIFGQKLLNTQFNVGKHIVSHPSWNRQMHCKSLQKKFSEAKRSLSQKHQLVRWYRWVPRTLT